MTIPIGSSSVVVIAAEHALPRGRVWGTGGWISPTEREALDWLTLARFLGWDVGLVTLGESGHLATPLPPETHTVIVASDPDALSEDTVAAIASRLDSLPMLVIGRAGTGQTSWSAFAGTSRTGGARRGQTLTWRGPGPSFHRSTTQKLSAHELVCPDSAVWATLDDAALIAARPRGRGIVATLGVHPSEARDWDPTGTALMKALLTWGVPRPVAWLDFDHTMVLRMDDPGGAQNVYSRTWCYPKLTFDTWRAIGDDLAARQARISLAYISGWVDDGDEGRGHLTVAGHAVARHPGTVFPSPLVRYEDVAGHSPGTVHDYESEFQGILALRRDGVADVELHGFTHMHPDREAWLRAADRFESRPDTAWFRELGPAALPTLERLPDAEHPLVRALELFREYFGILPTTLICPGDQWTDAAIERALDLGLQLVGGYYLAIRDQGRFCWAQHVCAPYLSQPDQSWFLSGLPIVGYFHDYELALRGVGWMTAWLDRWQESGARRFIDFRELASALGCRIACHETRGHLTVVVDRGGAPAAVRPIPVRVRARGALSGLLTVQVDGAAGEVELDPCADGTGLVKVLA